MLSETSTNTLVGPQAFERLRAEHELPWLINAFERPKDFELLAAERSVVVFGSSGTGKTATRFALEKYKSPHERQSDHLMVHWIPPIPLREPPGSEAVELYLKQIFNACAQAMILYFGRYPLVYENSPDWVKDVLRDFIQTFLADVPYDFLIRRYANQCTSEGLNLLQNDLRTAPSFSIVRQELSQVNVIAMLVESLRSIKIEAVWIIIDGLEPWVDLQLNLLTATLRAILSSLALFENNGFILKMLLPIELESALMGSGGVSRRRIETYTLEWTGAGDDERLVRLVERRLQVALGREDFTLSQLVEEPDILVARLKKYGGAVPRGWLELVRSMYTAFQAQEKPRPLSHDVLTQIEGQQIPKLRIDMDSQRVYMGHGEVLNLDPSAYKVLEYLYRNRHRICSREEVYYIGYQKLEQIPRKESPGYEPTASWRGTLDTALWRARSALDEARKKQGTSSSGESSEFIYLITYRNKGLRLENTQ